MRSPPGPSPEPRAAAAPSRGPARASLRACARLAVLLLPCACAMEEEGDYFDLEADPVLVSYGRVTVSLEDTVGRPRATLFDDSLTSISRLRRLPARAYDGGRAHIVIRAYLAGLLRYRETRLYDGRAQRVLAVRVDLGPFAPGEGNPGPVGPRPPVLADLSADTTVSIHDSVAFRAEVLDGDGDLAGFGLDCDGDGRLEDTGAIAGSRALIRRGRRYAADTGSHACRLRVWDAGGRAAEARLGVRVLLDPPVADAGEDTTVTAGSLIHLHARGTDGFGPVSFREWKIGNKPFALIPQQETVHQAPETPGSLTCILRVTDSDGLTDEDTLVVHVIARTGVP